MTGSSKPAWRSSRWLWAFVAATLAAALCVTLGVWQWQRREVRVARNDLVQHNYDQPPAPIADVITDPAELPESFVWRPVALAGRYLPDRTVVIRTRPLNGLPGYYVTVPFQLADGRTVVVNRGWVPGGASGSGPDVIPPPPAGDVSIVGRLRKAEAPDTRTADPGQAFTITPSATLAGFTEPVTAAYLDIVEEPVTGLRPKSLPKPPNDEGPHLSYSLQWFVFALGCYVALWVTYRRRSDDDATEPAQAATGSTPATGSSSPVRPGRRKPTAEDIEDAQLDALERGAPTSNAPH